MKFSGSISNAGDQTRGLSGSTQYHDFDLDLICIVRALPSCLFRTTQEVVLQLTDPFPKTTFLRMDWFKVFFISLDIK